MQLHRLTIPADSQADVYPHKERALCVSFSPGGDLLAIGDAHDWVKVWRVDALIENARGTGIELAPAFELQHSSDVNDLRFAPDGANPQKHRLATLSSEGEASVWSLTEGPSRAGLQTAT
jgi:WD40 repeat protein